MLTAPSEVFTPQGLAPPSGRRFVRSRTPARVFPTPFGRPIASAAPASQKVTVPSGVPVGTGDTIAVRVTAWPSAPGLGEIVSVVVVLAAASIVTVTGSE